VCVRGCVCVCAPVRVFVHACTPLSPRFAFEMVVFLTC